MAGIRKADFFGSAKERDDFVEAVFWNILDVHQVNSKLCDQLTKRQKQFAGRAVDRVGDILAENVPNFEPFVHYGAHQLFAKHHFEEEKVKTPAFAKFVEVRRVSQSLASAGNVAHRNSNERPNHASSSSTVTSLSRRPDSLATRSCLRPS
jgi:hypothetical protein